MIRAALKPPLFMMYMYFYIALLFIYILRLYRQRYSTYADISTVNGSVWLFLFESTKKEPQYLTSANNRRNI